MVEWSRGLDKRGRIFTIGVDGERASLFFPNEDGEWFHLARGNARLRRDDVPVKYWKEDFAKDQLDKNSSDYQIVLPIPSRRTPGEYFPRIWLGTETPHPRDVGLLESWISTVRSSRMLFAHLRDVFRVVEPTRSHSSVYSLELRQLLILACTEVESGWKAILQANGYKGSNRTSDRWTRKDYRRLLDPLGLDLYAVGLSTHPGYGDIQPFQSWRENSLPWYDAYNTVKHDREGSLHEATLEHVIQAMAAVFIMTMAQFGRWTVEQDTYFNPDEFTPLRYPRGVMDPGAIEEGRTHNPPEIGDWYIRPLPSPADEQGQWPDKWRNAQHPALVGS